jgi:hypothetical protein
MFNRSVSFTLRAAAQAAALSRHAASVYGSVVYNAIPGYDSEGNVVAVPDRDQSGPWQR